MNRTMTKRERIEFLLQHYPDFWVTIGTRDTAGDGEGIAGLPRMAHHPSVVELCRCLDLLSQHAPIHYQHLKAYYTAETRTIEVPVRRKAKKGIVTVQERRIAPIVPRWVRQERVRRGVAFVTDRFQGSVFLPNELLEAA